MLVDKVSVYNLENAILASGLPMTTEYIGDKEISEKDLKRASKLGHADEGSGHDCFLKGILVVADITAPQYWWQQFQRYHFADIVSSMSKMHKILSIDLERQCNIYVDKQIIERLKTIIRDYIDKPTKFRFQQVISNCPMGLEMTAQITTNYLQLKTIYHQRRTHKLEEWQIICDWVETLPMFKELILD